MTDKQVREKLDTIIKNYLEMNGIKPESLHIKTDILNLSLRQTFPTLGMERLNKDKVANYIYDNTWVGTDGSKEIAKSVCSQFCVNKVVYPEEKKYPLENGYSRGKECRCEECKKVSTWNSCIQKTKELNNER